MIFTHQYDEDRDVNPIPERQNISRWLVFIQTIFWTLPNPIQTSRCPNQPFRWAYYSHQACLHNLYPPCLRKFEFENLNFRKTI